LPSLFFVGTHKEGRKSPGEIETMNLWKDFSKGLWKDIPPFRLVLGLCPTLAVTTAADSGLGMGLATTFVLTCSNALVSAIRSLIPREVRIVSYILIIASFVVMVELLMQAYFYRLYEILGIFIPLIVVNCIILGRAVAFASKRPVLNSVADGLGYGIGFTVSLTVLGAIREILGAGTLFSKISLFGPDFTPFSVLVKPPGAFICLGLLLGIMNLISRKRIS
jgi:electron transport complex protein RnfE